MSFVKYPSFVRRGPEGQVLEIMCKVCGTPIAGYSETLKNTQRRAGGQQIQEKTIQWHRFHNWTELKMVFSDGSAHITHGCDKCMHRQLTLQQLDELHNVDVDEQGIELGYETATLLKHRTPTGIVALKKGEGSIL